MTNIAELVKYVLLPYNDDVTKPRALNTFLERLIKNKKLLSDLIEKEKGCRDGENASKNKSNVESLSDGEEEGEEIASENGSEAEETQESDNDSEETESVSSEKTTIFHSKNPCEHCENSNVYGTLIMKCPKCCRHDYYKICSICDHQIPEDRNNIKEGFFSMSRLWSDHTQKREDIENHFLFFFYRRE